MQTEYLVVGAEGLLGSELMSWLSGKVTGVDLPEFDVTDRETVEELLVSCKPRWIINCSGITDVDLCERNPSLSWKVHRDGVRNLLSSEAKLLTIGTDQVFSGRTGIPWTEEDNTNPVNQYAESKLAGDLLALEKHNSVVVRTSWLFAEWNGLVPRFYRKLSEGKTVKAVTNQMSSVTFLPDLVEFILEIIREDKSGLFHFACCGGMNPFSIAEHLVKLIRTGRIQEVTWEDLEVDAERPEYSVLGTSRNTVFPDVKECILRWRKTIE